MARVFTLFVSLLLASLPLACESNRGGSVPVAVGEPITEIPVELKKVTVAQLDQELAKFEGKVVVADIWFLGCSPCVAKFPSFVEVQKELAAEGIVCVSIDCMASEADNPKVLEFLKKQNATFPNFLIDDAEETTNIWFERHGLTSTPALLIYNKQGEFVKRFEDASWDKVKKFVREVAAN